MPEGLSLRHGSFGHCLGTRARLSDRVEQRTRSTGSVGVLDLPVVAELGHGLRLPFRDEDRVVAEALAAARLRRDRALERAAAPELPCRRQANELAAVARAAVLHTLELGEKLLDVMTRLRPARGVDSGAPAERVDLDPRVLPEDPRLRLERPADQGLRTRVLVVRLTLLGRGLGRVEPLDPPARERPLELACLVLVSGRELGEHSAERVLLRLGDLIDPRRREIEELVQALARERL